MNSFFFKKKWLVLVKPDQIVSYVTYVNNLYDLVYFITRAPDTWDKSAKRATRKRQEPHECDTSATQTTQVQVKKIDFDNNTSENIFSQLYIRYMGSKRLKGEKQFHSKNYLLQNALFSWQTAFQKWTLQWQKLYVIKLYAKSKSYTLDCILLTEQNSLSGCLNLARYWAIFVLIKPCFLHDQNLKTKI